MKNRKKLPKFYLGTRKPATLGYQPNRGIGTAEFTVTPGINVLPETLAAKANYLPLTLGRLQQNAAYPMQMLLNMTKIPIYTGTAAPGVLNTTAATNNALGNSITNGMGEVFGTGSTKYATSFFSDSAGAAVEPTAEAVTEVGAQSGTKTALNAAGKVAGIVGSAYGAYNIANDIANAGSHRSISDMRNTMATKTYTTAGGNLYIAHSGPNISAELDYEKQTAKLKLANLTVDAMGFGASAGGLAGSIIPGVGTLLGTGLGAALGFLGGGLASALGFGDNSEEVEELARLLADHASLEEQQNASVAKSKDLRMLAANGKRPVWTPAGLVGRKATARVSNGEVIGNFEDGLVTRVAGEKNNKDTKLAALKDGDFVISNKYGLSDYAAATGDYAGALNLLEMIMGMRNSKGYKNGKLPKCAWGLDTVFSVAPHLMSLASNIGLLNRAENANVYAPDIYVDNPEGTRAVNELAQLGFNADPYYREARNSLNQNNYNIRRNVGLGAGGRMIALNSMYLNYLKGLSEINTKANEANAGYRTAYAQALANLGNTNLARRMEANAKRHQWLLLAMGAKENWIAQYKKNIDTNLLNMASEYMKNKQYGDSLATNQKMLDLYEKLVDLENQKYLDSLNNKNRSLATTLYAGIPLKTIAKQIVNSPYGMFYNTLNSPAVISKFKPSFKNGKLPCHEDGLVDTRSDTTYQGYNPNPIPWGAGNGAAGHSPLVLLEGLKAASLVSSNPYLITGEAPSPGVKSWAAIQKVLAARKAASMMRGKSAAQIAQIKKDLELADVIRQSGIDISGPKVKYGKNAAGLRRANREASKIKNVGPSRFSRPGRIYNNGALSLNDFE